VYFYLHILLFKFAAKIRDGERQDKEKSAEAGKTNAETGIVVDRTFMASHPLTEL
jgi:hypothetical protein